MFLINQFLLGFPNVILGFTDLLKIHEKVIIVIGHLYFLQLWRIVCCMGREQVMRRLFSWVYTAPDVYLNDAASEVSIGKIGHFCSVDRVRQITNSSSSQRGKPQTVLCIRGKDITFSKLIYSSRISFPLQTLLSILTFRKLLLVEQNMRGYMISYMV